MSLKLSYSVMSTPFRITVRWTSVCVPRRSHLKIIDRTQEHISQVIYITTLNYGTIQVTFFSFLLFPTFYIHHSIFQNTILKQNLNL